MKDNGIKLTQCGQPRPYADSIYAGTVTAESEQEARDKLQEMRGTTRPILDKQGGGDDWSRSYFTKFRKSGESVWEFSITQPYTG
jgi:hypothetical protein